jgi:hypothetical protein
MNFLKRIFSTNDKNNELHKEESKIAISIDYNSPDEVKISFLKNNIGYFTQAGSEENAKLISSLMVNNERGVPYSIFRKEVLKLFPNYEKEILEREYDTFYAMAQCYSTWQRIENQKDILPFAKYEIAHYASSCSVCKKLSNIVLPVNDPFWDIYFPPNCDECTCLVLSVSEDNVKEITDLNKKKLNMPEAKFALNVGKHELKKLY